MNQTPRARRRASNVRPVVGLLLLLGAVLTVAWTRLPQTRAGIVVGRVTNGTAGAPVPTDLSLTLHTFSDMAETGIYSTTVAEDGAFRFEGVALEEGYTAVVRVVHEEIMYVSPFAEIEAEQNELNMPVTIYETTEDATNVSVTQLHLFVNKIGDRLELGQYVVVGNAGDRTYVGAAQAGRQVSWSVALPEAAEGVQFDQAELDGRFVTTESGFADTRAVPPGEASVETSFTYELPFEEGMEIEQAINVPVRSVVLVLPEGEWGLEGASLGSEGALDTQMGEALSYSAGPLQAGEPLSFRMVPRVPGGAGTADASRGGSRDNVAVGVVAVMAAGVAVTLMWRSGPTGPIPAHVQPHVESIAALDREYAHGTMSESEYLKQRRSLKRNIRRRLSV